jgi:hypothetical protein
MNRSHCIALFHVVLGAGGASQRRTSSLVCCICHAAVSSKAPHLSVKHTSILGIKSLGVHFFHGWQCYPVSMTIYSCSLQVFLSFKMELYFILISLSYVLILTLNNHKLEQSFSPRTEKTSELKHSSSQVSWKHSSLMNHIPEWFSLFYFTLLLAVGHQKTEISRQTADCSGRQCLERTKSLSMGLAEAHYRHWGTRGAYVLSPFQAFYPWQRALKPRKVIMIFKNVVNIVLLPI